MLVEIIFVGRHHHFLVQSILHADFLGRFSDSESVSYFFMTPYVRSLRDLSSWSLIPGLVNAEICFEPSLEALGVHPLLF
jgi:hypothetical protein